MLDGKLYIETIQSKQMVSGERNTYPTSAQTRMHEMLAVDTNIIENVKKTINDICDSFTPDLMSDELEVEFSFGVTGEGNICILSGSTSMGIKVKMLWKKQVK